MNRTLIFSFLMILLGSLIYYPVLTNDISSENYHSEYIDFFTNRHIEERQDKGVKLDNLISHEPIVITSDFGFTFYDFQGYGNETDPYIIENLKITDTKSISIHVSNTRKHFVIRNCELSGYIGIELKYIESNTISIYENDFGVLIIKGSNNCTIAGNSFEEMDIVDSNYTEIIENTSFQSHDGLGIYIEYSNYCKIISNICHNKRRGLMLRYTSHIVVKKNIFSDNTEIGIDSHSSNYTTYLENECNYNRFVGLLSQLEESIIIENNNFNFNNVGVILHRQNTNQGSSNISGNSSSNNEDMGIDIWNLTNSDIMNNSIVENGYHGIRLSEIINSTVYYNLFHNNGRYGVSCAGSNQNSIHHNDFVDNNPTGSSQARDNGHNTKWYDENTKEGNFWSDLQGENSYLIDGDAESSDPYPLSEPLIYIPPEPTEETRYYFSIGFCFFLIAFLILVKRKFHFKS